MTLDQRRLRAARDIFEHLAERLELRFSVRLWDGSMVAPGGDADGAACITIAAPGVLGSLLRRPTVETLLRHYAAGASISRAAIRWPSSRGRGGTKAGPDGGVWARLSC